MRKIFQLFILLFPILALATPKELSINIVDIVAGKDEYYIDLLKRSFEESGYNANITVDTDIPLTRVEEYLDNSRITLHWYADNARRRKMFPIFIDVGLTNGLIGKRILFIPKGEQKYYDKVKSLDDFRNLGKVGAFGKGWYDVSVWKENNLAFYEKSGDYRLIFNMLNNKRNFDYFSRGTLEILTERKQHPTLDVEKNLLLVYDNDFKYFFSEGNEDKKAIIEKALQKAKRSGLIDRMLQEYFPEVYSEKGTNLLNRRQIMLSSPK